MGSLAKTYSQEKLFGQIYTPKIVVEKILNDIGFNHHAILGKTILDPACGDGRFLTEIAQRIIEFSPKNKLKQNLENIYGWDINSQSIELCVNTLNDLVKPLNLFIDWNIFELNSILKYQKPSIFPQVAESKKYDFIVGNPPYIRIQHLDQEQRRHIQNNYDFCKNGSTDIYIAFFELAISLLNENGICGFITPNTFLYTETAKPLRQYFAKHQNLLKLTNYADIQIFDNVTTYSAITIFNKKRNQKFNFQKAVSKTEWIEKQIEFTELQNPIWRLSVENKTVIKGKKLEDIAKIHVGITTLCDKAYIFTVHAFDKDYVIVKTELKGKVKLEKELLKPIVKGSTLKNSNDPIKKYILFPYKKINGKHQIISENELQKNYPLTYEYLLSIKSVLDKRDNGKPNPVAWYAFGRSQGLDTSFGKKIIFSPMNNKPNFVFYENEECTFYSGYCIKFNDDFQKLLKQLNSVRMQKFVEISSRDFRGGWKAYNKRVIENFIIDIGKI
ncbi:MAG: N-6 DNA methylase [Candidatus Stahlbacteria bacterium]|nr:N-6 DNA methylase [Candidatus Stahlbacteria bacterium]